MAALAAAGLAAATLMAGQLAGTSAQAAELRTTTLTVPADTQMTTFNPFLSYYDGELDVLGAIYPTLTMLDNDGKPIPYLADSWTTSADQLTWTFKIHPGLKWTRRPAAHRQGCRLDLQPDHDNATAATANGSLVDELQVRHRAGRQHAGDHDQAAAGQHALPEHPGLAASRSCPSTSGRATSPT